MKNGAYGDRKDEYHGFLKKAGIDMTYNKSVHAKIMVLDRAIAIVSSMNLYSASTAGASWEAGLISIENTVVESVMNSIRGLLEKPESMTMK
jgi:phosphatidylserine/phosphatidylglycerophosphate/cardiolipin synthase-like enzyme